MPCLRSDSPSEIPSNGGLSGSSRPFSPPGAHVFTTFDRYLLVRFLHVFMILFVSTFGLFVVIDGFTNIDEFQGTDESTLAMLGRMATFYLFQSSLFLGLIGPILAVIAVMVIFALLQKNSEIHPILSAGIPTLRLMLPMLAGVAFINGAVVINQELVIPNIAHRLQAERGANSKNSGKEVEPVYDHATHIHISGQELYLGTHEMKNAKFALPPDIAYELTTLKADTAVYSPPTRGHAAGWLLKDVRPSLSEINLSPEGREIIRADARPEDVFVVTDVSFDHLYNRTTSGAFASTPELLRRIRNPAYDLISVKSQILRFHERLTKPLLNVLVVLIAVPLIVRRESRSIVMNMAVCSGVLIGMLGVTQAFNYLGTVGLVSPELSVWAPTILTGTLGAWTTGLAQT